VLPFTPEQFADVFAAYNETIWPAQLVAYALCLGALVLLRRRTPASNIAVALILAAMWMWTGIAYHALFFARINGAAYLSAALFVAQGGFIAAACRASFASNVVPVSRPGQASRSCSMRRFSIP
jgi:hypothetical protein